MTTYGTIPTSSSSTPASTNLEYISRAKARLKSNLSTRRPWAHFFDHRQISLPSSLPDSIQRLKTNLSHFATNYAIISLIILLMSLLWHPISLIVFFVMVVVWLFLYFLRDQPLVVFNRRIDDRAVLVALSVLTLLLLFLTDATWNIVGSVAVAAVLVLAHAVFRNTDDLSGDDEESGVLYSAPSSSSS